jgi:ferredoxin
MPVPGAPSDNTTMVGVLEALSDAGYTADFWVDDDAHLCCRSCGTCVEASSIQLDELRRVEGASDPADMAAILALTCTVCGARGTAVVRFGPEASAAEGSFLRHIEDLR